MARLESVSTGQLVEVLSEVEGKAATQRLMAAINWKEEDGATQAEIAERYGFTQGWLSQWLRRLERLEDEPVEDVVYDEPRSGRTPALDGGERERFLAALSQPPSESGLDAPAWTVPLARRYLEDEFGVEYSTRHVRRFVREAGGSTAGGRR